MIRQIARIAVLTSLASLIAACGKVGDLEPRTGQALPPKAYGQTSAQSAEALSAPSVQARPGRSDELLRRSERREDDPFDLAPGREPAPLPDPDADEKAQPKTD